MDVASQTNNKQPAKGGPNPGLLRPPVIFLCAILLGIALNWAWRLHFLPGPASRQAALMTDSR